MKRHLGWAILAAIGILLGLALNPNQRTNAGPVAVPIADFDARQAEIIDQLKEINAQLKELNAVFRTGDARVTVVINPSKP
jgi:hypothetical protein